jgi:hypothetical protein
MMTTSWNIADASRGSQLSREPERNELYRTMPRLHVIDSAYI